MPTLNHFVYNIRNSPMAGQANTDDNKLNPRQIEFWISYYRAAVLKEMVKNRESIDNIFYQDLGIVPLTEVDMTDQDCSQYIKWGCTIKKTKIPIPVTESNSNSLLWVGFVNKIDPISIVNPNHVFSRMKTMFGKNTNRSWIIGDTLYISFNHRSKKTKYINIRGIFEDPTTAFNYSYEGCDKKCFDEEVDNYPLSEAVYQKIVGDIFRKELFSYTNSKPDDVNNGRQDTKVV